jgi:hypothetical protein
MENKVQPFPRPQAAIHSQLPNSASGGFAAPNGVLAKRKGARPQSVRVTLSNFSNDYSFDTEKELYGMNRDGAVLQIDGHLNGVLEFMQETIPANKLVGVAERIPELARLLWSHNQQEPISPVNLTCLDLADGRLLSASESALAGARAGDDSVEVKACR